MTSSSREWNIGPHVFRFEPPDVLWAKFQGGMSLGEAMRMVALYRELGQVQPFFMVAEMRHAGLLTHEASRYLSEHLLPQYVLAACYLEARLAQRAQATGLVRASQLTDGAHQTSLESLYFASTREEVLALLAELRGRMGRTGSRSG